MVSRLHQHQSQTKGNTKKRLVDTRDCDSRYFFGSFSRFSVDDRQDKHRSVRFKWVLNVWQWRFVIELS